jgi:hypothetical protein
MHYLPLSLPFFSVLVGVFVVLLVLLQLGALRYAYLSIGLSPGGAMLVLFGSLVGSYFNIPLVELPQQHIVAGHVVHYFGMRYVVPVVVDWPGTVIAANVGGAIIPVVVSAYLLVRYRLWFAGVIGGRLHCHGEPSAGSSGTWAWPRCRCLFQQGQPRSAHWCCRADMPQHWPISVVASAPWWAPTF